VIDKIIGAITGTTAAAKKAAAETKAAADLAKFKPFDIKGSIFSDVEFGDDTATYTLSPELAKIRDSFFEGADYFGGMVPGARADADRISDFSTRLFDDSTRGDRKTRVGEAYREIIDLLEPQRMREQTGLANNLFNMGTEGLGMASGTGGYTNPARMDYLTSLNRENSNILYDVKDRVYNQDVADQNRAIGMMGLAPQIASNPYNYANQMFGYGSGVELQGQQPMMLGMNFGAMAQPGRMAQAQGYGQAAQYPLNASLANIGMFTNLLGTGLESGGVFRPGTAPKAD